MCCTRKCRNLSNRTNTRAGPFAGLPKATALHGSRIVAYMHHVHDDVTLRAVSGTELTSINLAIIS